MKEIMLSSLNDLHRLKNWEDGKTSSSNEEAKIRKLMEIPQPNCL